MQTFINLFQVVAIGGSLQLAARRLMAPVVKWLLCLLVIFYYEGTWLTDMTACRLNFTSIFLYEKCITISKFSLSLGLAILPADSDVG